MGAIELKLPESTQGGGGGGGGRKPAGQPSWNSVSSSPPRGSTFFHYFNQAEKAAQANQTLGEKPPDIPLVNGQYDYDALNAKLAEVKRKALYEIVKAYFPTLPPDASLYQLSQGLYIKEPERFRHVRRPRGDQASSGEDKIKYQTVVAVMDAARGTRTPDGNVTMFPNVSIAGGIIQ